MNIGGNGWSIEADELTPEFKERAFARVKEIMKEKGEENARKEMGSKD